MVEQTLCNKRDCNSFKSVSDDEEWNHSMNIIARKVIVYFKTRSETIRTVKHCLEKYGQIEKIELFDGMNIKIAHVTYKNSSDAHTIYRRYYYEIEEVRLVEMAPYFLQPGCIEMTSIMELPDDCLIQIFKLCGLFDQAALSVTCERFRNLMVNNIFHEIKVFRFENWNDRKVIIAASQVIQSINPLNFELTEHVNLFDRNATMLDHLLLKFDCDKRVLNITHPLFNEYNDSFEKISDRFECLIILNVNRKDLDTTVTFKTMFRSVTSLFIESGTDIDVPKINNLNFLPNLQKMYFLSFFFGKDATIKSYYELNPNLREVYVAHCSFFSDKSFVKFLCYEENHDITVKYDYLTFRSSSIRRVKLERLMNSGICERVDIGYSGN